jgi:hypothetical protein
LPPTKKIPRAPESAGVFAAREKRNPIVCLLLTVVTLALYNPVNRHPFVNYDDDRYVTENPHVRQGLTFDTVRWALTSTEQANWHPVTWMSHALDVSVFRLNPAGHHLTSVLLHVVNVVLLFLLLVKFTSRLGPSLFVAALFAVHPINVESVAWVAERKNVLCTFFFFLTLWAYGWYARKPNWQRYLAVAALFAAGLASKPMVITLPFVLLLLDYWPLARVSGASTETSRAQPTFPWSRLALEKLPLLALSAASAMITMQAQQAGGAVRTSVEVSFGARIANAIYVYAMYLWKMVWPARLAPLYPHPGDSLAAWRVMVAAVVLLPITAVVWQLRTHRYLLVGWLWFLGTLVPVIGLVQVGEAAMADRYAYIPLIGIFVAIAFGVAEWAERQQAKQNNLVLPASVVGVAVLIILAFVVTTHRQIAYWQSNYDLWSHTLAVTQNNFVAENNLGGALILEGREEEAYPHFEMAARINPKDPMSRGNLGTYYQMHGRLREAVEQYEAAVQLTSDPGLLAGAHANLGAAYFKLGEYGQARNNFEESLRLNPNQARAWLGLGRVLAQGGRPSEALDAYRNALKISPDLAEAEQAMDAVRQPK